MAEKMAECEKVLYGWGRHSPDDEIAKKVDDLIRKFKIFCAPYLRHKGVFDSIKESLSIRK